VTISLIAEVVAQANNNGDCDPTFTETSSSNEQNLLTQWDLNNIVNDLKLLKKQAERLGSRFKGCNRMRQNKKVSFYRGRHYEFKDFFYKEDGVIYFNDVSSVIEFLGTNLYKISVAYS
jgi:hypothetical protein